MNQPRLLVPTLFAALVLAAIFAGCAGGSNTSGSLPTMSQTGGGPEGAAKHKRTHASLTLHIPRKPRRDKHGPAYVSPNMQSLTVGVQLAASASPWPSLAPQTFVVATPQPCSVVAGGGLNCTFALKAYAGMNVFTFNEYAQKSPTPQDTPLATLTTAATNVDGSPLSFTIQGVVNKVALTVADPESSSAPNTQALPIGTATSFPLTVDPYDSSNSPIATDAFSTPITIQVSPATAGVTLALNKQCTGDTATATKVTLNCASDLTQVSVAYDGTAKSAGGISYVQQATLTATPQLAASTPAPAIVALASNILGYQMGASGGQGYGGLSNMAVDPVGGKMLFAVQSGSDSELVEFDPANPSAAPTVVPLTYYLTQVMFDPSGNIWTDDAYNGGLHCFTSISASPVSIAVNDSGSNPISYLKIGQDRSGHIWYAGQDSNNADAAAGYFADSCTAATATSLVFFGNASDAPYAVVAAPPAGAVPGIWAASGQSSTYSLYGINTSSGVGASPTPAAAWPAFEYPEAMVDDPSYNAYSATQNSGGNAVIDEVAASSANIASLLTLAPNSSPMYIDQYSGSQSSAQALLVSDDAYNAAILASPVSASTEPLYLTFNNGYYCGGAAFDATGGAWIACELGDGSLWVYHPLVTSTWSALPTVMDYDGSTTNSILAVPQSSGTDDSPFTVTVNPSPGVIATGTPWPAGFSHSIPIQILDSGNDTLTIADKNGRTQQVAITVLNEYVSPPRPPRRHHHPRGYQPRPGR